MDKRAMAKAKFALATIDQQVHLPWSEEQERILREAYETLSWQCSPLGVGIEPLCEGTLEIIFHAAENFKWRLDKRYPGWQEIPVDATLLATPESCDANDASFTKDEREDKDQIQTPPGEAATGSDCRCTNHTGPHWLYHDYWWYERNLKHLERCALHLQGLVALYQTQDQDPTAGWKVWQQRQGTELAFHAFIVEDHPRIKEKLWHMQVGKIDHISYEALGPGFEDLGARERALLAGNVEMLKSISEMAEGSHDKKEQVSV